jgi:hypothetical protein
MISPSELRGRRCSGGVIGVVVYVLMGILIGRKIGKPSTIFDAIPIGLIWALFWPFKLLLIEVLRRILREEGHSE